MGRIYLDDLDKYDDEASVEKFTKKRTSNPNKKHKKTSKKKTTDFNSEDYEDSE